MAEGILQVAYDARILLVLADKLKPLGLNLTLTLHAPNSAYKGYDYRALGELADRISSCLRSKP
ncbi:MAG: hypothetical protein D9V47_11205 [Clostridia bacterium]|nr:MAG: hypothetical protein D9V47_11205 [Clostridia bacterium]